jgi:type VI secretion system secreted protein VgrG
MAGGQSGSVGSASDDANQNLSSSPAGSPVQSCGSAPESGSNQTVSPVKQSWISIKLVDQDNHSVPGEPFRIKLPDGSIVDGQLDKKGLARISGIDPGSCQVSFPNRDAKDWKHL